MLAALPRELGNPWVVPGAKPGTHMANIDGAWQSIRAQAGLHDVRIHDLHDIQSSVNSGGILSFINNMLDDSWLSRDYLFTSFHHPDNTTPLSACTLRGRSLGNGS